MEHKKFNIYIGIDISQTKLEVKYNNNSSVVNIANKIKSFKKLKSYFGKDKKRVLVLLEATSGYENAVIKWLLSKDISVVIINTKYLTDFAKLTGHFKKNNPIDAAIIRQYGQAYMKNLNFEKERSELEEYIKELNYKKNILLSSHTKQECCLSFTRNKGKLHSIKKAINFLDKRLTGIEKKIADALDRDNKLIFKIHSSMGTKVIAPIETHTFIGELVDLDKSSCESKAALISIVPYRRDRRKKQRQNGYLM